ncbi:hypothetical protein R6Q59_019322 [Mikania micrantha]
MASMVNLWLTELTKLRQKIQSEKTTMKKSNLILKSVANQRVEEESRNSISKSSSKLPAPVPENRMTEETVFWLMDRFAPC